MSHDQRQFPRKVLRTKVILAIAGQDAILVKSTDVGANGISVGLSDPLTAGQMAQLRFDLLVDGRLVTITAHARATHCIFSHGEFKVGFQFQNLELAAVTALARYMR